MNDILVYVLQNFKPETPSRHCVFVFSGSSLWAVKPRACQRSWLPKLSKNVDPVLKDDVPSIFIVAYYVSFRFVCFSNGSFYRLQG